ncbi:uncharacterized protein BJ212DRAFT_1377567, partial [Suillus subaureus]
MSLARSCLLRPFRTYLMAVVSIGVTYVTCLQRQMATSSIIIGAVHTICMLGGLWWESLS